MPLGGDLLSIKARGPQKGVQGFFFCLISGDSKFPTSQALPQFGDPSTIWGGSSTIWGGSPKFLGPLHNLGWPLHKLHPGASRGGTGRRAAGGAGVRGAQAPPGPSRCPSSPPSASGDGIPGRWRDAGTSEVTLTSEMPEHQMPENRALTAPDRGNLLSPSIKQKKIPRTHLWGRFVVILRRPPPNGLRYGKFTIAIY